ncbi:helix-turn-helix domain-containing protein [Geochorda subterranea]
MEFLTISETAHFLGIDRSTAYLKVKQKQIPVIPLPSNWR